MEYSYSPDEYLKLIREYEALERMSFSSEDDRDTVIGVLEERSKGKREVAKTANAMIREYVETFEQHPEELTDEDAKKLEALQEGLTDPKTGRELDLGIMLRIMRILKDHYRRADRLHEYIKALRQCIMLDRLLVFNHMSTSCDSPYFNECEDLSERFFELPEEDRVLLFSTLYWICIDHEDDRIEGGMRHPIDKFLKIDEKLHALLGERYEEYFEKADPSGIARNSISMMLEHFLWMTRHKLTPDVERFRPHMERYSAILREKLASMDAMSITKLSLEDTILHADYQLGKITIDELLNSLTRLQSEVGEDESPSVQAARLGKTNYHYLVFLHRFSGYDRETIIKMSRERVREAFPRILKITREVNNSRFNMYLMLFILGASYTSRFEDFSNLLLELTVYSDKALYVHTEMVKEISLVLFDHMIETSPEVFEGVAGRDAAYIQSHKQEMRELLSDCCMFHDTGKFFMLDIVGNSMRRLTDEEFAIIRTHPIAFEEFSRDWMEQDERLHCIRDCAEMHHLWHDGTRGYPTYLKHTKNRPFVDILAIADSLDAATDIYGRPYRLTKTLEDLIGEFKDGSGTRYGPEAVSALSDDSVREKLRHLITEGRKDIYYRIYSSK